MIEQSEPHIKDRYEPRRTTSQTGLTHQCTVSDRLQVENMDPMREHESTMNRERGSTTGLKVARALSGIGFSTFVIYKEFANHELILFESSGVKSVRLKTT